ncbi:DNA-directed RNA polymerase subunit omega [Candidatus Aminicenantes bacterium AC-335-K20]|nr:DNA-directed RNA polymerase subunit omega [SCandidatus Aminicenantes bacterium Aminicenantia_JdfR_composite]MCP2596404.1 DNA-directed RNA polymerase subunit omega [Candidatus Aminicenantes bacterium AC-335-G13]MCP2598738.1 DNA-directed RNA polymerase subunit omega [Candidatus Aminicenantes bacterium AC-335-L06]MCP2606201.1 DNA-directed RNA polymerase subunit omega [Candidatus Aminicenantes bacterium AC-708-I09]MCP2618218.1 DNA-directed RNA polymerase subunit omega [Candidatus Aminicenantes b
MKELNGIDSRYRFVIIAAKRSKQLLKGAKPKIKTNTKNLIKIAQEEVAQGLVKYEILRAESIEQMEKKGEEILEEHREKLEE